MRLWVYQNWRHTMRKVEQQNTSVKKVFTLRISPMPRVLLEYGNTLNAYNVSRKLFFFFLNTKKTALGFSIKATALISQITNNMYSSIQYLYYLYLCTSYLLVVLKFMYNLLLHSTKQNEVVESILSLTWKRPQNAIKKGNWYLTKPRGN